MNKIIRLTENDLHNIIMESVNRVLSESISGKYEVYADGEMRSVIIDERVPIVKIDDYTLNGAEAMDAISKIKGFLRYSNDGVENAIEQFLYDELR